MNAMKKILSGALCAFFLSGAALAQSTAENAQFLAELQSSKQFDEVLQGVQKQMPALLNRMRDSMRDTFGGDEAKMQEGLDAILPLAQKFMTRIADEYRKPEVKAKLTAAIQGALEKTFTAAEIDSMADYYRTPLGATIAKKLGTYQVNMTEVVTPITTDVMKPALTEYMQGVKKAVEEKTAAEKAKKPQ